jgi:hypothetical protein
MNKNSRKALIIFFMVALLSAAAFCGIVVVKTLSPRVNNIFFLAIWGITWMTDFIVIIAEPTYLIARRVSMKNLPNIILVVLTILLCILFFCLSSLGLFVLIATDSIDF